MSDESLALREPVLVTGATGFIGRWLIDELVRRGIECRALVLPGEALEGLPWVGNGGVPKARVAVVRGDVTDPDSVRRASEGIGTVVHLAAVVQDWGSSELHRRVTVEGTENVLGAAAEQGARAVLASSIVVYGDGLGDGPCPESRPHGRAFGPYSRSKQAQERIARRLEAELDLDLVIVRPANVFGPGSQPWVHEVLELLRRRQFTLIGGGRHDAGLCHVGNLVDVLLRAAARRDARGKVFNAADGEGVTWDRYFGDLARLAGTPPPRSLPLGLARILALAFETVWKLVPARRRPPITREALNLTARPLDVPIDRARHELGYRPRMDYEQALVELGRSPTPGDARG